MTIRAHHRVSMYTTPPKGLERCGKHVAGAFEHPRGPGSGSTVVALIEGIGPPPSAASELASEVLQHLFEPTVERVTSFLGSRTRWDGIEPSALPARAAEVVMFVADTLGQVYDGLPRENRAFFAMGLIAHIDATSATVLRTGDACVYRVDSRGRAEVVVADESIARVAGQPMFGFPHRGGSSSFGNRAPPYAPITVPLAPDDRVVLLDGRVLYQEPPDRIEAAIALRSIEEIVERLEDSDVDPTLRQWGIVVVDPASSPR